MGRCLGQRFSDSACPLAGQGSAGFLAYRELTVSNRHAERRRDAAHPRQWESDCAGARCAAARLEGSDSGHCTLPTRRARRESWVVGFVGGRIPSPNASRRVRRYKGVSGDDGRNAKNGRRARDAGHAVLAAVLCEGRRVRSTSMPARGSEGVGRGFDPATDFDVAASARNAERGRRTGNGSQPQQTEPDVTPRR
jgi:hypothetical protein